ncbi:MAG: heat-inducible transcriptional repressor HrcA [Myxococcales bacterium]|nr:heat-inducible transcriptional repressor HrcA [Myxococcales bacterium]
MDLDDRQKEVLTAILETFIATAEPVGSRTLSKRSSLSISPATIRNTMADLEDIGLLTAPHASAGRVPTPLAFRVYVERLAQRGRIGPRERALIQAIALGTEDIKDILRQAGQVLSAIARHAALVIMPEIDEVRFESIELLPLHANAVLAIFVARSGFVQHRVVSVEFGVDRDELTRMSNYLRTIVSGRTLAEVRRDILEAMSDERAQADKLMRHALFLGERALGHPKKQDMLVAGQGAFLEHPEFADIQKMRYLLRAFEEKTLLLRLLNLAANSPIDAQAANNSETSVVFGSDSASKELKELAVVTAAYASAEGSAGRVGIVGPTRMNYSRVIPLVEMTAQVISHRLENQPGKTSDS